MKHTPEVHLSQPLHCTTRKSVKRKRSDDIEFTNMGQTASELNHTTALEKQTSTNSNYKVLEIRTKRKKVKHYENE